MKNILSIFSAIATLGSNAGAKLPEGIYAEITTPRGVMIARLEYKKAPLTTTSFVGLAEGKLGPTAGKPFFDGLKFHRVVPGFVIQGGDPLGTGEGGPGYVFQDEFDPSLGHRKVGVLSMANTGPDTNGSQFFITLTQVQRLDYLHGVFGELVEGIEVPAKVQAGDAMQVRILRVGEQARNFQATQEAFDELRAETKHYDGDATPGPKALFWDPENILPTQPPRAVAFNYKLNNVQRATGVRIIVRLIRKIPETVSLSAGEHKWLETLGREVALGENDLLALRLTEKRSWLFIAGTKLAENNPVTKEANMPALFEEVHKSVVAQLAERPANTTGDREKIEVDAMLAALIARLVPVEKQ